MELSVFSPRRRRLLRHGAALAAGAGVAPLATLAADAWPARPVRIIVPSSPSGATDMLGRLVAEHMTREFGRAAVVDNRAGAGGKIGMQATARAEPDGYTLVIGNSGPLVIAPFTEAKLGYDVQKDFDYLSMLMRSGLLLVVRSELPVKNARELLQYMATHQVAFATSGDGQTPHFAAMLFNKLSGDKGVVVPYKGAPPAMNDLLGGSAQAMFDTTSAVQYVKDGRLRAIGVTSRSRSPLMPEVPTMVEQGLADFDLTSWFTLMGPRGLPAPVVARVNGLVQKLMSAPETRQMLAQSNGEAFATSPEEARAYVAAQAVGWQKIFTRIGTSRA